PCTETPKNQITAIEFARECLLPQSKKRGNLHCCNTVTGNFKANIKMHQVSNQCHGTDGCNMCMFQLFELSNLTDSERFMLKAKYPYFDGGTLNAKKACHFL
ncbi:MAG: hypothetical protein L3J82_09870, partial [Planctomycetes bacterium]|nr:hypothetical protein [Planctomycetota bacterium]